MRGEQTENMSAARILNESRHLLSIGNSTTQSLITTGTSKQLTQLLVNLREAHDNLGIRERIQYITR